MALTPAEKQKAYRQRLRKKKEGDLKKGGDDVANLYQGLFSEWVTHDGNFVDYDLALALAGIDAPMFADERGPEEFVRNDATEGVEEPFGNAEGALGRAEIVIGCVIDAITTLAGVVNAYKKNEISQRLVELENSTDIDRARAMKEAVRLNKILDQLDKPVRRDFPQWKVTGI